MSNTTVRNTNNIRETMCQRLNILIHLLSAAIFRSNASFPCIREGCIARSHICDVVTVNLRNMIAVVDIGKKIIGDFEPALIYLMSGLALSQSSM